MKTNSPVNVSRKPGLDLSFDLLQHLQYHVPVGKLSSFLVLTFSCVDFSRRITNVLPGTRYEI